MAAQAQPQAEAKNLVTQWIQLKDAAKKTESEEQAAARKELNERKTALQSELFNLLRREGVDCGKVDIGEGAPRYVRIVKESRPKPVTVDIARAAVGTGLKPEAIKAMVGSLVGGSGGGGGSGGASGAAAAAAAKPLLIDVLNSAALTTIRELSANHVERLQIAESRKRRRSETDEEYLNDEIQKKARRLHQVTEEIIATADKKPDAAERRERLKQVEAQLSDHLTQTGQAYNYARNVDGEIRYFHVKVVETIEPKPVTVTAAKDVVRDTLETVFKSLKIPADTLYTKSLKDEVLHTVQKAIEAQLVEDIKRYESENAKEVRKLQVDNGRAGAA